VGANVCYTGGWLAEAIALRFWGQTAGGHFGQIAFVLGFFFSIALTLAPIALVPVGWLMLLASRQA
jgi:hypothetical protein